jgi:hypothetical protein
MNIFHLTIVCFTFLLICGAFIFFAGFLLTGNIILLRYLVIDVIAILIFAALEYKINQYR